MNVKEVEALLSVNMLLIVSIRLSTTADALASGDLKSVFAQISSIVVAVEFSNFGSTSPVAQSSK
jgi:hypothetical protein